MVGGRRISGHGSFSTSSLRAWWRHRPWLVGVLGIWLFILALLLLHGKHTQRSSTKSSSTRSTWSRSKHSSNSNRGWSVRHATCDAAAQPSAAEVQQRFAKTWGHSCVPFRQACYDQGTFVVFGSAHHPQQGGASLVKALQLGNNHLDFRDFGDVIGTMQYPEIIFRSRNSHEESPDLRSPVSFSNCARPVVLYLNHLFMFGDFWVRTMPTLMNALQSNNGTWDTDYTIVVATGGQRLQAWQKLLLQPFSKHPIMTLSAASSRAVTYLQPDDLAQSHFYEHNSELDRHSTSSSSGAGRRRLQWDDGMLAGRKNSIHQSHLHSSNGTADTGLLSLRRTLQQQQQKAQPHKLTAQPPITVYGRCFESLTVCKLQDPHGFPDSIARPVWSGAQHVRQFWEQQYGARYKQLLPQHQVMKQGGALRVMVAIRGRRDVRSILNQQELLDWCNAWKPHTSDGQPSPKYTRTVCIAHEFGQHGSKHNSQPTTAAAAGTDAAAQASRNAGNAGTPPPAAAAAVVQGPAVQNGSAAVQQADSSSSSSSSRSAGKLGLLDRVQEALLEASGTFMGVMWGHSGTRNLLSMPSSLGTSTAATAAAAAAAAVTASQEHMHQQSLQVSSTSAAPLKQHQQQQQHATSLRHVAAAADLELDPSALNHQQQQQQQHSTRHLAGTGTDLPADPELDPRGLLADVALLDECDVLVGLHGAQLSNALYMPAHKALVEVRPYQFTGGWPESYFKQPLTSDDKQADGSDGIFWFGIDTVNASNSKPGKWEVENRGCCHQRDRHTRIEPAALEYMLRRIVWAAEDVKKYKQLASKGETHITDTLQPAEEYHKQHSTDKTPQQQQQQQQELQDHVAATRAEAAQQQTSSPASGASLSSPLSSPSPPLPSPSPVLAKLPSQSPTPPGIQQQQQQQGSNSTHGAQLPDVSPDPVELAELEQDEAEQQDEQQLEAMEALQLLGSSSNSTGTTL